MLNMPGHKELIHVCALTMNILNSTQIFRDLTASYTGHIYNLRLYKNNFFKALYMHAW